MPSKLDNSEDQARHISSCSRMQLVCSPAFLSIYLIVYTLSSAGSAPILWATQGPQNGANATQH